MAEGELAAAGTEIRPATASVLRQERESLEIAKQVAQLASDKLASDILLLDIRQLSIIADYFVICSADNERQMRAITRGILEGLDLGGISPLHAAGVENESAGWVLLDYGDVIVHVFSPDQRAYYELEQLWAAAPIVLRIQ